MEGNKEKQGQGGLGEMTEAAEMAYAAFGYVKEIAPLLLIIGGISVADLIIWFLIRLFKKMPTFKW